MKTRLDHVVVAVSDWGRSNDFYARVMGAEVVARGQGFAYRLGNAQFNLYGPGVDPTPVARQPVVPGNSDLCIRFDGTIEEARAHLNGCGVVIELGPVERSGFGGAGHSLYFRDPDGSLLEFLVLPETGSALKPVVLENEWVRLEPLRLHHVDALWEAGRDPRVWQYLSANFAERAGMERFVRQSEEREESGTALPFAIYERASEHYVGSTSLFDFSSERRAGEVGWTWHSPSVWGTKVNFAAKLLLLTHCFEALKLVRVCLKTDILNERSQRAMEKLGATREGVWRKQMQRRDGSWRDSVYFSIVDDEWSRVKAGIEERLR